MSKAARYLVAALSVLVVGLIGFWLMGPASEPVPTSNPAPVGGALVSSIRSEPRTFNPHRAIEISAQTVSLLSHARLVRINRVSQEVEPWLAESWTVSPDGLTYTLTLRQGVAFSDGTPFTSADVLFSFESVYDESTGSSLVDSLTIRGQRLAVSAPDPATVVLTFPGPFGPGLRVLDNLPIVPKHRLQAALADHKLGEAWGTGTSPAELAGLGPFVLSEYVPGQRLVFSRNPHYWRTDAEGRPLPYLDRLTLEILPDQNSEVLRLETGQLDCIQSSVRPEDYASLKRVADQGRLHIQDVGVSLDPNFFWFNLDPQAKLSDPRRSWLQSLDLRRAVSHAVDREAMANTVYLGAAILVYGKITSGNKVWYSPDAPTYPYDPEKARALLAGLGLSDRDRDGMLEDATGQPARFSLLTQKGNTIRERSAAVIQEDLRKVGLTVDVVSLEQSALIGQWMKRDYDAMYFGTASSDTDPALELEFWLSSGSFHAWNPGQAKPATDWEAQIDDLIERQVTALEPGERKRLFDQVQQVFAEHLPAIYFAAPRVMVATSTRVANATPAVLQPHVLWNPDILAVRSSPVPTR